MRPYEAVEGQLPEAGSDFGFYFYMPAFRMRDGRQRLGREENLWKIKK